MRPFLWRQLVRTKTLLLLLPLVALGACSEITTKPPTEANIQGLSPSGYVNLTETFVIALGGGTGKLQFQGQDYPFTLFGTVVGPSASLTQISVSGEVYKLNKVSDFAGAYAQSSGPPGLEKPGAGDLWLANKAGVIMHLTGQSSGVMLSLGRDEVLVRM
jgi:hypothetical protein